MMKFLTLLLLFAISTQNPVSAFEVNKESLKLYGVPCLLTIGASAALIKNNGIEVGAASCLAITAATYLNSPMKKASELEKNVSDFQNDFWERVKSNSQKNKEEISYFKDQIRKVVAKKIVESQLKVDAGVSEYLSSKEFKSTIKTETMKILKENYPEIDSVIRKSVQKNMNKTIEEVTKRVTKNIMNSTYAKVGNDSEERNADNTQLDEDTPSDAGARIETNKKAK